MLSVLAFLADEEIRNNREFRARLEGADEADRLRRVVVLDVVPSVHEVARQCDLVAGDIGGAAAKMSERNCPREQKTAGVVPVVLGLDDFGPERRDELSEVDRELVLGGRDVGLLNVAPRRTSDWR